LKIIFRRKPKVVPTYHQEFSASVPKFITNVHNEVEGGILYTISRVWFEQLDGKWSCSPVQEQKLPVVGRSCQQQLAGKIRH
jgi:ribosome-associated toxin RatA of RatAB toxin-antitoxin module